MPIFESFHNSYSWKFFVENWPTLETIIPYHGISKSRLKRQKNMYLKNLLIVKNRNEQFHVY